MYPVQKQSFKKKQQSMWKYLELFQGCTEFIFGMTHLSGGVVANT